MTGYGKAEKSTTTEKFTVEIRSLNGKNCDLSIKSSLIPRDKEIEMRQHLAQMLVRGNIDMFASVEQIGTVSSKKINRDILMDYYRQVTEAIADTPFPGNYADAIFPALLKLPDVIETQRTEMSDESWDALRSAIEEAASRLIEFRTREGEILKQDVCKRVGLICSFVSEVEKYEAERVSTVRDRIVQKVKEVCSSCDENRLEQEIVFYVEKLDINEEKVRLRQHCRYFLETVEKEEHPGKKLGFIAQEMGREINTMGSKANHVEIQKWVVKMKDELEKIKEQSLNIL
ncbi:MAG: YicC family protein [Bacteroidales bacterium]|nr:YicC family protein [Bacteroidales bacterium]MBO7763842.1 YicC family protein [Bacteroidales bacterium]